MTKYRQSVIVPFPEVLLSKQPRTSVTIGFLLAVILEDAGYDVEDSGQLKAAAAKIGYNSVAPLQRVLSGQTAKPRRVTIESAIRGLEVRPGTARLLRQVAGY